IAPSADERVCGGAAGPRVVWTRAAPRAYLRSMMNSTPGGEAPHAASRSGYAPTTVAGIAAGCGCLALGAVAAARAVVVVRRPQGGASSPSSRTHTTSRSSAPVAQSAYMRMFLDETDLPGLKRTQESRTGLPEPDQGFGEHRGQRSGLVQWTASR